MKPHQFEPTWLWYLIISLWLLHHQPICQADVSLPPIFGSHMVLQHGREIPIAGSASPGEKIKLVLGDETKNIIAEKDGRWSTAFSPRKPSFQPVNLTIEGKNKIILDNVVFGDVWLCSGQSNMQWTLKDSIGGPELARSQNLSKLRLLHLRGRPQTQGREFTGAELEKCNPRDYLSGSWEMASSDSALEFSGVAIFFGHEIMQSQNIPIGLVQNAVGGTPIESWLPQDSIKQNPKLRPLLEKDWYFNEMVHSFCRDRAALNLKKLSPELQLIRPLATHPYHPGFMFESGISPLQQMQIKGVIWYQGESNAHDPALYRIMFPMLIQGWRQFFHQPEMPFLFVQLPNFSNTTNWPELREIQRDSLSISSTGMAVTIDLGDPSDVHPRNKAPVGHRLALLARAMVYGESIESAGPIIQSALLKNNTIHIQFTHVKNGLKTSDGQSAAGFEIAGNDGTFRHVKAEIINNAILISTDNLNDVSIVRYGWSQNPSCNLVNQERLPASPFQIRVQTK